jgi:hypothetical protein
VGLAYSTYGGQQSCIQDFGAKPEGMRPIGRRHMCYIDITMDLQAVGWGVMDWIDLTEGLNGW